MPTANEREALLIVDLQEGFVTQNNRHVVYHIDRMQTQFHHVYASKFMMDDHDQNERFGRNSLAFEHNPNTHVFEKTTHNAATPEIIRDLQGKGINTVHICGLETNVCVLATAIALLDAGFTVTVRAEACASNSAKYDWGPERFHEAAMMIMKNMAIHTWGF